MQTYIKSIFRNNSLFFLNIFILIFLTYGLLMSYGGSYLGQVFIYLAAFVGGYIVMSRFSNKKNEKIPFSLIDEYNFKRLIDILIFFVLIFQVIHYLSIGNIPVIKAMMTTDYYYITHIRQDIKGVNSVFINYTASFIIKSLIPVLLYILYDKDKKRFWILFALSVFYSLALMQKAYIVTIFIPLTLNFLLTKRWWRACFLTGVFMSGVVFLVLVTNPGLRPFNTPTNTEVEQEKQNAAYEVSDALYDRVFITTGKMVGHWFYYVPDSLPYLHGSGYRFLAPVLAEPYHDYSREIYNKVYQKEAAMGFTGTATTAFFMYDYSNFGNWGLVLAGLFLAFFLLFIRWIFKDDPVNMFALNGLFIIWLSSAAITTTLFSGGWILTILLYLLFKPYFKSQKTNLQSAEENH